jgi:hypothetical protein
MMIRHRAKNRGGGIIVTIATSFAHNKTRASSSTQHLSTSTLLGTARLLVISFSHRVAASRASLASARRIIMAHIAPRAASQHRHSDSDGGSAVAQRRK